MFPKEFMLADVRCFEAHERGVLRPLTLLVGENSTGKTTFLGCYRALQRILSPGIPPVAPDFDFNQEPFAMGSFRDIVRMRRGPRGRIDEFQLRYSAKDDTAECSVTVTFAARGSQPHARNFRFDFGAGAFLSAQMLDPNTVLVSIPDCEIELEVIFDLPTSLRNITYWLDRAARTQGVADHKRISDYLTSPLPGSREATKSTLENVMQHFLYAMPNLVPIAPLRSKPKRTYDPITEATSPEGTHIPMLMMRLDRTAQSEWKSLHDELVGFGAGSGLFADIKVKTHGKQMSDPFQLQIKVRSGSHANIMDVGYGVSQSLPILVDIMRGQATTFLLQQPEVHLHPRGQAELASLFVKSYLNRGHHFLIETHSDFIVDRIRICVQEGILRPTDVSILYFEPKTNAVRIHSIELDDDGNLRGLPHGYRRFFARETNRLLGFKD